MKKLSTAQAKTLRAFADACEVVSHDWWTRKREITQFRALNSARECIALLPPVSVKALETRGFIRQGRTSREGPLHTTRWELTDQGRAWIAADV